MMYNILIGIWIVLIIVNAVYNASEIVRSRGEESIEFLAIKFRLDLLRIGRTYCRDRICVSKPAF